VIRFLWVCLGGAIGTGARYLLSIWGARLLGPTFPYATLFINVLGSFLIGAVISIALQSQTMSTTLRLSLTTGVLGGFTTYSSFNHEVLSLFESGRIVTGLAYLALTVFLCLGAGMLGTWLGRTLT
jgi:fluoride exporter